MAEVSNNAGAQPLTASQLNALWQAERRALRLYAVAVTILAAALGLSHLAIVTPELRYLLLLGALALVLAAVVVHLAIRCPRCNARLGAQSLLLPAKCKSCGVEIAHPRGLDSELDA